METCGKLAHCTCVYMYFHLLNPCLEPLFPTMDPSERETKDEALGAVSVGASVLILVFSCVYMYVIGYWLFICMLTGETFSFLLPAGPGGLELWQPLLCQPSLTVSLGENCETSSLRVKKTVEEL